MYVVTFYAHSSILNSISWAHYMGISGRAKALLPTICGSRYIPHESARDGGEQARLRSRGGGGVERHQRISSGETTTTTTTTMGSVN